MNIFNKDLVCAIGKLTEAINNKQTILDRIDKLETYMALKLSELTGRVGGLEATVLKIWNEQQGKYDALAKLYEEVKAQLENVEVPAEAETALTNFETKLKEFDDTIPDTTA